ncbi:MAG TPA: PmeII family type II restriction endonuclease [bacterium]|nr:PmeII family type II restriction endonuclease [bacterium]HOG43582.1 PmeII family type II restriction endonuclease [bacterium]HPA55873.1 PmeII family type II restriction endonuclease [bacterium]HQB10274.1 PmeII family type II restriction endonuclease [bacterium]HQM84053.1 PmeII family type II restriction endonuclease [bacterium]
MEKLNLKSVVDYVEKNIGVFHQKRIKCVDGLKLKDVLKRKNPYLFKAKNVTTSEQIIRGIVDAYISSNEETIFGDWLEGLAIFINGKVYGGRKSGIAGIDLDFEKDGIRYIVTIKSGPNWGNNSQIKRMKNDFVTAKKTLRTSNSGLVVMPINGCCYGKDAKPDKGDYFKYCGQRFWEFVSGDKDLYIEIIEPLGHKAKERNEEFQKSYSKMINKFTKEFSNEFCMDSGEIDWEKLVRFNSSK